MGHDLSLSRRGLGQGLAGVVLAFSLRAPGPAAAQPADPSAAPPRRRLPGSLDANRMLDAWIQVRPDGGVTVCTGKVELGQGAVTALMQIAAEELDVAPARVAMISGDTALTPDEGYTAGSQSLEFGGTALRFAAAEARAILLEEAARRLGAPAAALAVADGAIAAPGGAGTTYWAIAEAASLRREATASVAPKPPARHTLVGTSHPRLDIPAKVTGGAIFVQDMRLPGMLFGRVARPPHQHARLASLDDAAVRDMPGVVAVVRDGSFLGVLAEREEQAVKAREALLQAAAWDAGAARPPDSAGILEHLKALPADSKVVHEAGGAEPAPGPARRVRAAYAKHYLAHASIGPSCAVARFAPDGSSVRVWSHTQGVFPLRRDLAKALRMPEAAVTVSHAQGSGCYGHNGADDVALDAALLARAVPGRPVKLQWMRDDEFAWEPYNPAMLMEAEAGLSADGRILDWRYDVWSNAHSTRPGAPGGVGLLAAWHLAEPMAPPPPMPLPLPAGGGDRNAVPPYDAPRRRITQHFLPEMPLRVSAFRTLGAYANVFAVESFMDELAAAAGADPVAFRLRHLPDPRARAVVEAAVRASGWRPGEAPPGPGRGFGIGYARYKTLSCHVACVAEVALDRATGTVRVPRIWAAADAGQIINPDGLVNQIEGGIIQAASWTLKEEVRFGPDGIESRDWQSYPILTFAEVPRVETVLLNRPDQPPLGAGEASQGPAGAAIANALAVAAGKRIRVLPLTPERVKAALG